jgi:hypothetical protein
MAERMAADLDYTSERDQAIGHLVDRAGELKGELVAFAQSPRFARHLDALLFAAADRCGELDEGIAILTIDHFALQYRLSDGRAVVERFVAQRRPRLPEDEQRMLLGWREVVEGYFEVRGSDGDAVVLRNLLDDLDYRVFSTMGRAAFALLRRGTFVVCRIVPVRPDVEAWLVSGTIAGFPRSARHQIAQVAVEELTAHPERMRRNPTLLGRAWDMQAEHRAEFIAQVGSDAAVLSPGEAQRTMCEHYGRLRRKTVARPGGKAAGRGSASGPLPYELGRLPDDMLDADTVALIYDEVEGLHYFPDFGRLEALFDDPAPARDTAGLAQLRGYLRDDSVSPLALRRLAQRHPDGVDRVFRALLRKPDFSWSRDGEGLMRREKKALIEREPTPSISVVGNRLAELLWHASRRRGVDP